MYIKLAFYRFKHYCVFKYFTEIDSGNLLKIYIVNVNEIIEKLIIKELISFGYEFLVFEKITNMLGLSAISGDSVLVIGDEYHIEDIHNLYEKIAAVSRNPVAFLTQDGKQGTTRSDNNLLLLDASTDFTESLLAFLSDKKKLKVKKSKITRCKLTLNIANHLFTVQEKNVYLTNTEFNIIHYMMASEKMNISHDELMIIFKNKKKKININTLANHIRNINNKIFSEIGEKKYIKSIYGFGYGIRNPD